MNIDTSYEGNIGIIKSVAGRVYRRCLAASLPVDMDDCVQEATISWIKASRSFEENKGYTFSTYYTATAYRHLNRFVKKYSANNFLQEIDGVTENVITEEMHDETPEAMTDRCMMYSKAINSLSKPAALTVKWLISPPKELIDEIALKAIKSEDYKQAMGNYRQRETGVNISSVITFVVRVMGLDDSAIGSVRRELRKFRERGLT